MNSLSPKISPFHSPHLSPISQSPRRPTSLALWDQGGIKENWYVDEPGAPNIVIQVSSSSPSSPEHFRHTNARI